MHHIKWFGLGDGAKPGEEEDHSLKCLMKCSDGVYKATHGFTHVC